MHVFHVRRKYFSLSWRYLVEITKFFNFKHDADHHFAWILWYIWKGKNNKVFINLNIDPRDIFKLAETESVLWAEAQINHAQRSDQARSVVNASVPTISGRWCFTDGS